MNTSKSGRRYDKQFKLEAVALVQGWREIIEGFCHIRSHCYHFHAFLLPEHSTCESLSLRAERIDENRFLRQKMCFPTLITKHLRNFDFEIKVASINESAEAQSGAVSLIMNALQLMNWPQSGFNIL